MKMDADRNAASASSAILAANFPRPLSESDFAIFQDLLRNDESPYYQAIDFLLRSNDLKRFVSSASTSATTVLPRCADSAPEAERTFLCCSWVVSSVSTASDTYDFAVFASCVRTVHTATSLYQLRSMDHHEGYGILPCRHPVASGMRVSLVSFQYAAYRKQQKLLLSCPNLLVSLQLMPLNGFHGKALRHQKTLFGMHKVYRSDVDAAAYLLSLTTCIPRWNRVSFSFWSQMIRAQKKYPGCFRCCSTVPLHPMLTVLPDRVQEGSSQN